MQRFPRSASALLFALSALLAGCQIARAPRPPEPELQLLQAAPLEIPQNCAVSGSYLISYTVVSSGHTSNIRSTAPACVQRALTTWIQSFRYAPPARATTTSVEWLMVTAKRGS